MNQPDIKDKYYITYGIFYLLGILTFIPTYFVITASGYWIFKFRYLEPRPPDKEPDGDLPGYGPPKERNMLQASFFSAYFITSQLSLIIFAILTAVFTEKLPPPEKRILAALVCTLVSYIVHLMFVDLVTDQFQIDFFLMVLTIACFIGASGAVVIVSLFEMVCKFPMKYFAALLTGQPLCGVISAIIQILTLSFAAKPTTGGFIFFGIGAAMVFITIGIYCYSKRNSQYFIYDLGNGPALHCSEQHKFTRQGLARVKSVLKNTKIYMISLIMVFGTTAIIYPGLMSLVVSKNSNGHNKNTWVEMYFVPVITFFVANVCDLCGRLLATKIKKPKHQLVILTTATVRICFIPVMMFCNIQPRHLPVLFYDTPYIIFTIAFLFSNGYLISLCVIIIPTRVTSDEEKSLITGITVLSGVFSMTVCSFLSLMIVHLV